jgi:hypothetical protein
MIVEDATLQPGATERQRYILSNNHVLTNFEQGDPGDIIIRPSSDDIKDSFKTIGFLHRWVPLATGTYDVALATINGDVVDEMDAWNYPGTLDIKKTPITPLQRASVKEVGKFGRTTKRTYGTVTDSLVDVQVEYPGANGKRVINFVTPQIEITHTNPKKPFSDKGDSGSLVVDLKTSKPFGLIFGGAKDNQGNFRSLAHFLPEVLVRMNVRIVQESQPSPL